MKAKTQARTWAVFIKELRTKMVVTQYQFARSIGVTPITVSSWERGVNAPSLIIRSHLFRLAQRWDVEAPSSPPQNCA